MSTTSRPVSRSGVATVRARVAGPADDRAITRALRARGQGEPIRWAIVDVARDGLEVEATLWAGGPTAAWPESDPPAQALPAAGEPFGAVQILPTGIGLSVGGFAGDGTPATNLLARAADYVVAHPNAVNAAGLNWAAPGVLYVEGAMLDAWLSGAIALRPVRANRVGVLVDRAISGQAGMTLVDNAVGALRSVGAGTAIVALTDQALGLTFQSLPSGASAGALANPEILVAGARGLVERGAEAIAIVADFTARVDPAQLGYPDPYLAGRGVDPIGGLEAILSHLVWHAVGVPCAHAPFLWPEVEACDPRAAAEELGGTYLACVLRGLQRAPRPIAPDAARPGDRSRPDVVVVPEGAAGGRGTLAAARRGIPLIAVDNPGVLSVRTGDLGLGALSARSYAEAAGLVLALSAGMDPEAIAIKPPAPPS